jgi:alpha-galactosidase
VPQISVRLADIPEDHKRMVTFWTKFFLDHQALLAAPMEVEAPEMLYPLVRTRLGDEEAVAVYGVKHVASLSDAKKIYLFNATGEGELTLRCDEPCAMKAVVYNCMGEQAAQIELPAAKLQVVEIPTAGFAVIEK